jgi:hypothetical protein
MSTIFIFYFLTNRLISKAKSLKIQNPFYPFLSFDLLALLFLFIYSGHGIQYFPNLFVYNPYTKSLPKLCISGV